MNARVTWWKTSDILRVVWAREPLIRTISLSVILQTHEEHKHYDCCDDCSRTDENWLDRHRRDGLEHGGPSDRCRVSATVYTRTKSKAEGVLSKGAAWAESPKAVAEASDVIFAIVGFPADVREVMLGERRGAGRLQRRVTCWSI